MIFLFKAKFENSCSLSVAHMKGDSAIGWEPGRKCQRRLAEELRVWFAADASVTPRLVEQPNTKISMSSMEKMWGSKWVSGLQVGAESVCDSRIHTWKWPGELVTIPASVAGLNKAIQETSLITIFFFFQRSVGKDRLCHSPFLQNRKSLLGFTGTCWFTEIGTFCTECFHFSRADLGSDRFLLGFWLPLLSQPLACCLAGWQQWGAWQTREFGTCVHHTLAGQTCNPFKAYDSNGTW